MSDKTKTAYITLSDGQEVVLQHIPADWSDKRIASAVYDLGFDTVPEDKTGTWNRFKYSAYSGGAKSGLQNFALKISGNADPKHLAEQKINEIRGDVKHKGGSGPLGLAPGELTSSVGVRPPKTLTKKDELDIDFWESYANIEDPKLRQVLLASKREDDIRERFPEAGILEEDLGVAGWAGKILGYSASPETLLPIGKTVPIAAAIGGSVGLTDYLLYASAEGQDIDPGHAALATLAGSVLGPLVKLGGDAIVSWLKGKAKSGVTEADINNLLKEYGVEEGAVDSSKAAKEINDYFTRSRTKEDMEAAIKHDPEMFEFYQRVAEDADNIRAAKAARADKVKAREDKAKARQEVLKKAEEENLWVDRSFRDGYIKDKEVEIGFQTIKNKNKAWARKQYDYKYLGEDTLEGPMQQAFKSLDTSDTAKLNSIRSKSQGGYVTQNILYNMASGGFGGLVGYGWGEEEGAVIGAALGLGVPWTVTKAWGTAGKALRQIASPQNSRPGEFLKSWGYTGKLLARSFQEVQENTDLLTNGAHHKISRALNSLGISKKDAKRREQIIHVLQKVLPESAAPKEVVAAAKIIQKEFRNVLDAALDSGIIDKVTYDKLVKKQNEKGYWPRVYDEHLLSTTKGKNMWIDTFTSIGWSKESLTDTLSAILGESHKEISSIVNLAEKRGGQYYITKETARKLFDKSQKQRRFKRSGHLEHNRAIHVASEDLLNPFLVSDLDAVLNVYFHDTYKAITAAKMFGPKDQELFKAVKALENEFGADEARAATKAAKEIYFSIIGDSTRSTALRQAFEMNQVWKGAQDRIVAFETLKLLSAQLVNLGQTLVNGPVYLLSRTNPATALKIQMKGLIRGLGKEGREFSESVGAAAETTAMEMAGEYARTHSYIAGRPLSKWNPLEVLNNPTKFLKAIQFIGVEKLNRSWGANIGREYAIHLLKKKALIDEGKLTGKAADKILAQMDEIGLTTLTPAKDIFLSDVDMVASRVALRFSNEINFRNTPDKLPLFAQSPYFKLLRIFKTFAWHQGTFLKDNALKPLKNGNPMPLAFYLAAAAPAIGMPIDELRRMLRGDDREFTMTERYLRGLSSIGGFGLVMDAITSTATEYHSLAEAAAGPVGADLGKLVYGTYQAIEKGDPRELAAAAVRTQVLPYKQELVEAIKGK